MNPVSMNKAADKMRTAAVEMDAALRQTGWAAHRMEEVADKMLLAAEIFADSVDKLTDRDLHVTSRARKE